MDKLRPIMFVGTGSDVGKSVVNAGFCRVFLQDGYLPAPFKAQNMSLNSYATPDGLEIGRAQAAQAEACGLACSVEMNPILLKPSGNLTSQVIVNGKPCGNATAKSYFRGNFRQDLFERVLTAYHKLEQKHNPIVIEGAGSISELNLKDKDIVNMRVAVATRAATYLVTDIDRGGVFASVYGSIMLLPPEERACIKGVIINKFRGDISLFDEGKKIIKELTGIPVVGVLPYAPEIYIEQEDSVVLERLQTKSKEGKINIGVVRHKLFSNFTDFDMLSQIPEINLYFSEDPMEIAKADIIIIPGSKNTIADLERMHENGMAEVILKHHKAGKSLYGICGGYQMMGRSIQDPHHIEGDQEYTNGLGILPVDTIISTEKSTKSCTFSFMNESIHGTGYEIHMGVTKTDKPLLRTSHNEEDGYILNSRTWGTYLHGILDNASVINRIIQEIDPNFHTDIDYKAKKEKGFNALADLIRTHVDMDYIYQTMKQE
ncbi:cobyric acid synthase [Porphyromonas sp. COT-108 OH1349]|uniref:cobyric acid synthase n=1 Tax=Porphyromonas sp. COT-108 OH1349 TaxID=1537504 RepID=UPI00052BA01A|nr:cobyric acid synthase [Porphyromonas sp. COT-108 OH1349]KGN67284.1 cobalamin biosynthesis protein CobQ [Porphyromonas sp. COT-108 OH1349]